MVLRGDGQLAEINRRILYSLPPRRGKARKGVIPPTFILPLKGGGEVGC